MITILLCGEERRERDLISEDCRNQIAYYSDEDVKLSSVPDDAGLSKTISQDMLVNLLYYGFQKGQPLDTLRIFRRQRDGSMLMLITDITVSPLEYLRPGISPDSLLIRPLEKSSLRETNQEFLDSFFERFYDGNTLASFAVDMRGERILVPYSQIYFFEAREKRLFVRTKDREYPFYETMDALEERLPSLFLRCHRSYIVNLKKVLRLVSPDNYLELTDRIGVPISRRYRAVVREALS